MSDDALVLGIDVGTSRIKAVLVDRAGQETGAAAVPTPFATDSSGTSMAVDDLIAAVGRVVVALGEAVTRVAAVGVAGIAESGAPVDGGGHALAPVVAWHDGRGDDVAAQVNDRLGPDLAARIGRPLRAVSTVAKLGWLIGGGLSGATAWLGVPELCLSALTGAHATEHSLASATGCWDVWRRKWLPDVAGAAGFDVALLPEVRTAGEVMGVVSVAGAAWSHLPAGVPVTLAGHDHLVGATAANGGLVDSVGTAETVVALLDVEPDGTAALARRVVVSVAPGADRWAVMASAARAGLALVAAAAELKRAAADLDALATDAGPLLDAPGLVESLRRREHPVLPDGPPGAVWATLHDALATCTADAVSRLSAVSGRADRLVLIGGGATAAPAVAARRRRVGLAVSPSPWPEPAARGAALLAGSAAGWWPSPDERTLVG